MKTDLKLSELRIGNFVQVENGMCSIPFFKIDEILKQNNEYVVRSYLDECKKIEVPINSIISIPLTENILLGSGFIKSKYYLRGYERIGFINFSVCLRIQNSDLVFDWIGGNTCIKYLHQLQNLYFDLMGEELKVGIIK